MISNREKFHAKGVHILEFCDIKTDKARKLEALCEKVRLKREALIQECLHPTWQQLNDLWQEYRYYLTKLHKLCKTRETVVENITTKDGRTVIAERLAGTNTYSLNVSHTALGSGNSTPAVTQETLDTEVYRKAITSATNLDNVAYLETFFTATETSGTYEEYGNFIDGSGSADSGEMFNRFTETNAKSTTETMNVQSIITINDA